MEISFDNELAVACIPLADWAPSLVAHLGRYFEVREGILWLDYTHLSAENTSDVSNWLWQSLTDHLLRLSAHVQMLPILESGEETLVGGQAVMEGVMMRAPHSYCVAVRKADGELVTEEQPIHRMSEKYPIFKSADASAAWERLAQAMTLGVKALKFSANAALDEGEQKDGKKPVEISSWMMTVTLVGNLLFFIVLYKFVPLFLATQLGHVVPSLSGRFATNMTDGVIRMAIFLAFLFLLSRMKDIRRVFEYHGAEHKVVFNFESRQAGDGRERAEVRHLPSALRDQFPAGGDGDLDDRLRAAAGRRILDRSSPCASRCCR